MLSIYRIPDSTHPSTFTTTILQLAPITLITACMFSQVPARGVRVEITTIGVPREFNDEAQEIRGGERSRAALGESDANAASGELDAGAAIAG